ncbi:MAG TPA: dinitrogenase iron-molybdenum cofactor biosynthesis protein [Anaerolineae bacterium]|nr:dinitrogenase iron-molybdenum cofactor biosynthesis protein [Anaerolineae bacterium]
MRIAISADDRDGLDSVVSPHFGRCPYYILVNVEDDEIKAVNAVDNPYYGQHAPGVVPNFIHSQGVDVMLTGGMGGRAIAFFEQLGIEAVTGASGTVRHSLELYLSGQLRGVQPCHESIEHGRGEIPITGEYEQDEVGRLREEAEMLQQQLDEVMARLNKLEGRQ